MQGRLIERLSLCFFSAGWADMAPALNSRYKMWKYGTLMTGMKDEE